MAAQLDLVPLRFHPLSILEEGGEVVVGRTDIDSYGIFPAEGAALLEQLRAGRAPRDAADWYAVRYGEQVDVEAFVDTLRELQLLRDDEDTDVAPAPPVRWQRLGAALFSPIAWVGYLLLVVAAVAACAADSRLIPTPDDVFFTEYLAVVGVVVFVGQLPLAGLHELFHVLAGRRLGLRSRVGLGRRLHYVVFETVMDGLVGVPRRQRYLPMLAGLLADVLVIAALIVVAYLSRDPHGDMSLVGGASLALAFTTLPRIAWQFHFFLRTDIYYLVTTVLGCVDLHRTSRELLRNRSNALLGRHDRLVDESSWHPRDRRTARWYAPLLVVGYGVSIAMLVGVVAPLAWRFFGDAVSRVLGGGAVNAAQFWDSAIVLTFNAVQLTVAVVLALRERRANT